MNAMRVPYEALEEPGALARGGSTFVKDETLK
jgi:hypothetical protein